MTQFIPRPLSIALLSALIGITHLTAHASTGDDHAVGAATSATLTLAPDSIIDSINQLGALSVTLPKTEYLTVDGVSIAYTPLHQLPIVDMTLSFKAGAAYQDGTPAGTANMLSMILFQGTESLSEEAFITKKEGLGIGLSASADQDSLSISLRSLSDKTTLDAAVALMSDALAHPALDTKVLARNSERLQTGLRQQCQNPSHVAALSYNSHVYADHPYAKAVSGDERSVASITREHLSRHHELLSADRAVISITGDISRDAATKLAMRMISAMPKATSAAKPLPALTASVRHAEHIHINHPSTQTQVIIGHLTEGDKTDAVSRQAFSDFVLGNDVLAGGDFNARLMKTIREEKGYTYGIYGGIERLSAAGNYAVRFSTENDRAVAAITDTLAVINETLAHGIHEDELALSQLGSKNGFAAAFSSNAAIHSTTHRLHQLGYPHDHLATRMQRLDNATLTSVNQALQRVIKPNQFIIITVGSTKPDLTQLIDTLNKKK